jgi:hypothetical protein
MKDGIAALTCSRVYGYGDSSTTHIAAPIAELQPKYTSFIVIMICYSS